MHQLQLWRFLHFQSCAWYIECLIGKIHSSKQNLWLSIEKAIMTPPRVQTNQSTDDDVVVLGDTLDAFGIQDFST